MTGDRSNLHSESMEDPMCPELPEWPITPGEIECCEPCMAFTRKEAARGKPIGNEILIIHAICHRAPWEKPSWAE